VIGYADGCVLRWNIFDGKLAGKVSSDTATTPMKMALAPRTKQLYVLCNDSDESIIYCVSLPTNFPNELHSIEASKNGQANFHAAGVEDRFSPLVYRLGIQAKKLHVTFDGRVLVMDTRSLFELQRTSTSNKKGLNDKVPSAAKETANAIALNLIYKHEREVSAVAFEENVYWLGDVRGQIWRISELEKPQRVIPKKASMAAEKVDEGNTGAKQSKHSSESQNQQTLSSLTEKRKSASDDSQRENTAQKVSKAFQKRPKVLSSMYHWHADAVQALYTSSPGRLLSGGRENVLVYWRTGGGNRGDGNRLSQDSDNMNDDLPAPSMLEDGNQIEDEGLVGSLDTHFRPVGFIPRIAYPTTKASQNCLYSPGEGNQRNSGLLWLTGTHQSGGLLIVGAADGCIRVVHQGRVLRILKSLHYVSLATLFPFSPSSAVRASSSLLLTSAIPGMLHHLDLDKGRLDEWPIFARNQADRKIAIQTFAETGTGFEEIQDDEALRMAVTRSGGHVAVLNVLPDEGFGILQLYAISHSEEKPIESRDGVDTERSISHCLPGSNPLEKRRLAECQVYVPNARHDFKLSIAQSMHQDILLAVSAQERVLLYAYRAAQPAHRLINNQDKEGQEATLLHFQTLDVPHLIGTTFSQDASLLFCVTPKRLFVYHIAGSPAHSSLLPTASRFNFSALLQTVFPLPELHRPRLLSCQALLWIAHSKGLLIWHVLKGIRQSFETLSPPALATHPTDHSVFVILDGKLSIFRATFSHLPQQDKTDRDPTDIKSGHQRIDQSHQRIDHDIDQDADDSNFGDLVRHVSTVALPTSVCAPILSLYPTAKGLLAINRSHQLVHLQHPMLTRLLSSTTFAISPRSPLSFKQSELSMTVEDMPLPPPPLQSVISSIDTTYSLSQGPIRLPVSRKTSSSPASTTPATGAPAFAQVMATTLMPTLSLPSPAELFTRLVFSH
jgi:hypothetical protein